MHAIGQSSYLIPAIVRTLRRGVCNLQMDADVKIPSSRTRPVVLTKIYGTRLDTLSDTLLKLASATNAITRLNVVLRECAASGLECRDLLLGCFVALSEQSPALTPQLVLEQHSSQAEVQG